MMTSIIAPDYGRLLNEARNALHDLNLGRMASVYVDQNGERVEYTQASRGELSKYVMQLERLAGVPQVSGPMGVFF